MHQKRIIRPTLLFLAAVAVTMSNANTTPATEFPNNDRRILYNSDSGNVLSEFVSDVEDVDRIKAILKNAIDELAAAGVDTFAPVTCYQGFSVIGPSEVLEQQWQFAKGWHTNGWRRLAKAGIDARKLIADRCHKNGMEFVACIRMNDRHGGPRGKIIRDNPDWRLKGIGGGPAADFAQEPVRDLLLAYIEEVLGTGDVDGIEFDYMRWAHMFQPGQGSTNAHLLTDMTRKARKLLDDAAKRMGRSSLILGVRVPQTDQECEYLGYDLATWIKEDLVDYVVQSDFFFIDYNTRVAELVKLAEGTRCRIYPSISPNIGVGYESRYHNAANYRAAAHSFYAQGASGVQAYNYQYYWSSKRGHRYLWPGALSYLKQLRDPEQIARHDRHYRFYPLWPNAQQTGFAHDDRIRLDRSEVEPQGRQRFRLYENLKDPNVSAVLQLKAVGLNNDESIRIHVNGNLVPDEHIHKDRRPGQGEDKGKELPAFAQHAFFLDRMPNPIIMGDNELMIQLDKGKAAEGKVTIDDLEVYVYVRE